MIYLYYLIVPFIYVDCVVFLGYNLPSNVNLLFFFIFDNMPTVQTKIVKKKIVLEGIVKEAYRGTNFKVEVDIGGKKVDIMAYLCGRMWKNYIKIVPGDKVAVEITPYDPKRGRIIRRCDSDKNIE